MDLEGETKPDRWRRCLTNKAAPSAVKSGSAPALHGLGEHQGQLLDNVEGFEVVPNALNHGPPALAMGGVRRNDHHGRLSALCWFRRKSKASLRLGNPASVLRVSRQGAPRGALGANLRQL